MTVWIPVTILAALAQTARFGLQKQLKATRLSTGGATFARFIYSSPLVVLGVLIYAGVTQQDLPEIPTVFWFYALTGGAWAVVGRFVCNVRCRVSWRVIVT